MGQGGAKGSRWFSGAPVGRPGAGGRRSHFLSSSPPVLRGRKCGYAGSLKQSVRQALLLSISSFTMILLLLSVFPPVLPPPCSGRRPPRVCPSFGLPSAPCGPPVSLNSHPERLQVATVLYGFSAALGLLPTHSAWETDMSFISSPQGQVYGFRNPPYL